MLKVTTSHKTIFSIGTQKNLRNIVAPQITSEMIRQPTQHQASIYFAVGTALFIHILALIILSHLDLTEDEDLLRTAPTVTIQTGSKASINSQKNQAESANSAAANAYLATLESSLFKVQKADNNNTGYQKNTISKSQAFSANQTEQTPTKSANKQSQTSRAKQANEGMVNIFKQTKTSGEKTLISTTKNKELSDYEISLRSILSRDVLYDKYHQFMAAKGGHNKTDAINFEVSITLFANGAIKKAEISKSSGITEIDSLAKRTAYSVSPYPRPPLEDSQKGYKYKIAITWKPYKK